jgi:uncharacterized protein YgiM (DUF1202 family)
MKTNCWLFLGLLVATSAVAQVNTNPPPVIPAQAIATPVPAVEAKTNAPVKKAAVKHKKKLATKAPVKAVEKKISAPATPATPLVAGPATVSADNVNLRGQAGLKGEVVGHVKKGDTVTVISEISLDKPKADEPAHWAKIALPADAKVWVNRQFIDATNKVVSAKKLNLRGGPGENFSVLGVLEKGAAITAVSTKGEWTQIEPPNSAFAFVAANLLKQEAPVVVPVPTIPPVEPVPATPSTVPESQPIVSQPAPVPPPVVAVAPLISTPAPVIEAPAPVLDTNPPPPRIVTHEGTVRSSVSIVAPTYYELYDPANGKAINYLFSTTTNLNLGLYEGLHINVTGEEGLEARWKDTPVLTVQKIYVLSTNAPLKKAKWHFW